MGNSTQTKGHFGLKRFVIKSESSSREYVIRQIEGGPNDGAWTCSCPSWKSHKRRDAEGRTICKHLEKMGLQGPIERVGVSGPSDPWNFTDAAYKHYDLKEGFGNWRQWVSAAEAAAAGKGAYKGSTYQNAAGQREYAGKAGADRQAREQYQEQKQQKQERQSWSWSDFRVPDFGQQMEDLLLLGLSKMPDDVSGLKTAMRKKAMELHPDREQNEREKARKEKAFIAMMKAYERLLKNY